ncbi:response regulator [Rhodobacteraceae bacterium KMM 6894]|nr:response regulator [Rhodobacteraceae bacterium KMM 6894]
MPTDMSPAVLVVEDDPLIRMDAVGTIEDAGFRTYEAASATVAIEMMERHDDIAILFTDIEMPGPMNGLTLAAHVRDGWPPVAIIIASGLANVERAALPNGAVFLPKPYASRQVITTLTHLSP